MRTSPANAFRFSVPRRSTKHGRSAGPLRGAHATGAPCSPATEVNVPHSCVTRPVLDKSDADRLSAESIKAIVRFMVYLLLGLLGPIRPRLPWRREGKT